MMQKNEAPAQRSNKHKAHKRLRLILLWSILLASVAVLVFCIVAMYFTVLERKAARDQYAQIQEQYETPVEEQDVQSENSGLEEETEWPATVALKADKKIDFSALETRNPDVCGWISVEGTSIDYPILENHGADAFYLSHNIDGVASEHGTICLDAGCANNDFSDRVTIVYGHNMKDGSMFAPLYNYYQDAAFFDGDHRIKIYLNDVMLNYHVVSAYEHSYAHPLFFYDMTNDDDFDAYCSTFLNNRDLKARVKEAEISAEDHVLTLITSTNTNAEKRLFIQAVLVHD